MKSIVDTSCSGDCVLKEKNRLMSLFRLRFELPYTWDSTKQRITNKSNDNRHIGVNKGETLLGDCMTGDFYCVTILRSHSAPRPTTTKHTTRCNSSTAKANSATLRRVLAGPKTRVTEMTSRASPISPALLGWIGILAGQYN